MASKIPPVAPGVYLGQYVLPARGLDINAAADAAGLSVATMKRIVSQDLRIDPKIAEKLYRLTGMSPMSWLNMQRAADRAAERGPGKTDAISD